MNRVSTNGNYSQVLANIMAAQQRQMEAGAQVATQKKGNNLKDFARNAEMLTAMKSIEARMGGFLEQNKLISDKLTTQDFALNQIGDSADGTRQAIAQALAAGRADTLMQDLQGFFRNGIEGMNARYGGKYLFAGGKIDTMPVSAQVMADLTNPATPAISDFFHNDQFITQAKVDDSTTVDTGLLADKLGTKLMQAYKDIQVFQESGAGPFTGELTTAQRTFLEGVLSTWDKLHEDITNDTARNGMVQNRVDSVKKDLTSRQDSLSEMIGGIVDANMTEAATALTQAELAVRAASQVFLTLQNASLLNVLRP